MLFHNPPYRLTGVKLMQISRESSLRGDHQLQGSAVKHDGCNRLQWLASEVMHIQDYQNMQMRWYLSIKAPLRSSGWIRNFALPVKYSPNSCSSFMARSYVFLACSSVNLLFISLKHTGFRSVSGAESERRGICIINCYHRDVWETYIKESMDLGFIKMAMG